MLMFLFVSYAKRQNMHGTQKTIYYFKYVRTHSYAGITFGVFSIIPDGSWIACCAGVVPGPPASSPTERLL
jgi:hypothetical protein